jgi:hypothetical protein
MNNKTYRVNPIEYLTIRKKDACGSTRRQTSRMLAMRQRKLNNGILVNYTFDHRYGSPHFEFFSYDLSETGFLSDFFGYGLVLTKEEALEAFDIRANRHYKRHREWMRKREREVLREHRREAKQEREKRVSQIVQLTMEF